MLRGAFRCIARSNVRWGTINLPPLGDAIREATIVTVKVNPSEYIEPDQMICEVETDKLSQEIPCAVGGYVEKVHIAEGDTLEIGAPLIDVAEGPRKEGDTPKETPPPAAAKAASEPPPAATPSTPPPSQETPQSTPQTTPTQPAMVATGSKGVRRVKLTPMRKAIMNNMMNAQHNTAMLTTFNEINMDNLMNLRSKYKDDFEKKHGVRFGFMSAFVKAAAIALMEVPAVNASIDGNDMVYHDYADIGVAVATPKGLVVPVLRDCQNMSYLDVEQAIVEYANKAKVGKITLEDMQGGTFTISNGGVFGSLCGTPILNYPQAAILGMHKISKRAVVNSKGEITAANVMFAALTYDHRIIDGREAVTFLVRIKQMIEDPQRLLLGL